MRVSVLIVPRAPVTLGGKLVAYTVSDMVIDCTGRRYSFAESMAFGSDGTIAGDTSVAVPFQPLKPGSTFTVAADEACFGTPRAPSAPTFTDAARAAEYGRQVLTAAIIRGPAP